MTKQFTKEDLILYAKMCSMSYEGSHGKYELPFKMTKKKVGHTEWFEAKDKYNLYFVIQGSRSGEDENKDWKSNLKFWHNKILSKGVKYHRGHYHQASSIYEAIRRTMLNNLDKKFIVMGHSAGGSIAQILSIEFLKREGFKLDCFSEGSNRCMNKAGAKFFDKYLKGVRIVNSDDPVPKVPVWGYKHTRKEIRVGRRKGLLYKLFRFRKWRKNLVDHSPVDYVENLKKYLG